MPHLLVLEIVKLTLEITLEVVKSMPEEAKRAAWDRHNKRMEFWEDLFAKLKPTEPTP